MMKLILAQGNPESRFDGTRHNAGFFMIDRYARAHGAAWSEKSKFFAFVAEVTIDGEKVLLVKPQTYYNETGRSARALADFYKIDPDDILVLHDELALPFGTLRTRSSGSDAGNNGIKSLNAALGQQYKRLRIGIYNDLRDRMDDSDFVTGKFSHDEVNTLENLYSEVEKLIDRFVRNSHIDETLKPE